MSSAPAMPRLLLTDLRRSLTKMVILPLLVLTGCVTPDAPASSARTTADGLWLYTGLTSSAGESMPLSGIFLFRDGVFLQQAVFDGSPFEEQGAMAHAGLYSVTPAGVNLTAEQTISISPTGASPLSFRRDTKHVLTVDRAEPNLKLVFGSGTIQTFQRAGTGRGAIYKLADGYFALADGYFILVSGDEGKTVTGYGRYENTGDQYRLSIIRWAEVSGGKAVNQRDVTLIVRFDETTLALPDGRRFAVVR